MPHTRLKYKGVPITAFKHTWPVVDHLRRAGLAVPHLTANYPWPGPFKPMEHQRTTVEECLIHPRLFITSDPGTGKTAAALWAADLLIRHKQVRRVLIVSPKSTLISVWDKELTFMLPKYGRAVLDGPRARKQQIAQDKRITFLIVNPESIHLVENDLADVDLIIADEFTRFKNGGAARTKCLQRISKGKRLWLMSGTPSPQAPTDAHAPIRLQREGKYMSFGAFRDLTMVKMSQFRWVPRGGAGEIVAKEMTPAIRFRREDCFDLPDLTFIDRKVELTKEQSRLVKSFQDEAWADLEGKPITAANAASAMSKVLQVLAGGVYGHEDASGEKPAYAVDSSPLWETLTDIVQDSDGPVLIYAPFRISAAVAHVQMTKAGFKSAVITSGTTSQARADIFQQVQMGALDCMVAIPQTVAHGITLTRSNTIVWLSPPFSFETYEQANARIYRKGQDRKCVVYRLYQNRLTSDLYKRLDSRATLQDVILRIMEEKGQ